MRNLILRNRRLDVCSVLAWNDSLPGRIISEHCVITCCVVERNAGKAILPQASSRCQRQFARTRVGGSYLSDFVAQFFPGRAKCQNSYPRAWKGLAKAVCRPHSFIRSSFVDGLLLPTAWKGWPAVASHGSRSFGQTWIPASLPASHNGRSKVARRTGRVRRSCHKMALARCRAS